MFFFFDSKIQQSVIFKIYYGKFLLITYDYWFSFYSLSCQQLPQSYLSFIISRSLYGDTIIKRLRKFEKIDYRLRKAELDLKVLVRCIDNNVTPRFLNFRLANKSLRSSLTYA